MAIVFSSGFKIGSKEPIDTRFVLTKAEMLNVSPAQMPPVYIAICADEDDPDRGKLFIYDDKNKTTPDPITGRFRKFGIDTDIIDELRNRIQDLEDYIDNELSVDLDDIHDSLDDINGRLESEYLKTSDLSVQLPGAIIQAMEDPDTKEDMEAAIAGTLPGALGKALDNQTDKNSGLIVDENGNIKVNLNEEHFDIKGNEIDLAVSLIQAIESN